MYYYLVSGCTDPDSLKMALSVDRKHLTGNLVLMEHVANDTGQIWETAFYVGVVRGIVLINKLTGLAAYAPEDYGFVTQTDINKLDGGSTWTLGNVGPLFNAIRPSGNSDMNLNVMGNGPYIANTAIIVLPWSDGAPNESWSFVPADS